MPTTLRVIGFATMVSALAAMVTVENELYNAAHPEFILYGLAGMVGSLLYMVGSIYAAYRAGPVHSGIEERIALARASGFQAGFANGTRTPFHTRGNGR